MNDSLVLNVLTNLTQAIDPTNDLLWTWMYY